MADKVMHPADWCKKMMDEAENGDDAYAYHQLLELWVNRCGDNKPCNQ